MLKLKSIIFSLVAFCTMIHAQEKEYLSLYDLYSQYDSEYILPHDASWFPYPAYADREGWKSMLGEHADYLVNKGERYLDYVWQSVDATAYLAYERTGDRQVMEKPLSENRLALNALILAELAEGE